MIKRQDIGVVLIFAVCIFLSALVWGFFLAQIRQEMATAIGYQTRDKANLATVFAEPAESPLHDGDGLLKSMRQSYLYKRDGLKHEDVPVPSNRQANALVYRAIIDEAGDVVVGGLGAARVNGSDREYFKKQKSSQAEDLFMDPATMGRSTGHPNLHISRRITGREGRFLGVTAIDIVARPVRAAWATASFLGAIHPETPICRRFWRKESNRPREAHTFEVKSMAWNG